MTFALLLLPSETFPLPPLLSALPNQARGAFLGKGSCKNTKTEKGHWVKKEKSRRCLRVRSERGPPTEPAPQGDHVGGDMRLGQPREGKSDKSKEHSYATQSRIDAPGSSCLVMLVLQTVFFLLNQRQFCEKGPAVSLKIPSAKCWGPKPAKPYPILLTYLVFWKK